METAIFIIIIVGAFIYLFLNYKSKHSSDIFRHKNKSVQPVITTNQDLKGRLSVESFTEPNKYYSVDINKLTCTCRDFKEARFSYPIEDLRRFCKHLVTTLAKEENLPVIVTPYKEIIRRIDLVRSYHKGFPLYEHKLVSSVNGQKLEIFADTFDEKDEEESWLGVIFDGKYYKYGIEIDKWVTWQTWDVTPGPPPNEKQIVEFIRNNADKFRPKLWPEKCVRTVYRNRGKKQYSIKGEVAVNNYSWDIWAYLDYTSEDITVPTSKYSIAINFQTGKSIFPERTKHMEKAIVKWLIDEYNRYKREEADYRDAGK